MSAESVNPASDGEAWEDLDPEEQDRLLAEQMDESDAGGSTSTGDEEVSAEQAQKAIDLINQKMEETWTAEVLETEDSAPVQVSMYEPAESQMRDVKQFTKLYVQVQSVGSVEEISEDLMDELDDADVRLNKLLGGDPEAEAGSPQNRGLVAEDGMDFAYFEDPSNYPSRLRMELYAALFKRYQDQMGDVASFLGE